MADQVLENQAKILANQTKILANQEKILANQEKILAKNGECPSEQAWTGGVCLTLPEPAGLPWRRSGL